MFDMWKLSMFQQSGVGFCKVAWSIGFYNINIYHHLRLKGARKKIMVGQRLIKGELGWDTCRGDMRLCKAYICMYPMIFQIKSG